MIKFACPNCGRSMQVPENAAGKKGACKSCNETIIVPEPETEIVSSPPRIIRQKSPQDLFIAATEERNSPSVSVTVQQKSSAAHSLGIASMVLGILGLMVCWVPLIGLLGMPLSGLGAILGAIGLFIAMARRGTGIGFPIAGTAISTLAIAIAAFLNYVILKPSFDQARAAAFKEQMKQELGKLDLDIPAALEAPAAKEEKKKVPKSDKEWFRAEIPTGPFLAGWRDFDTNFFAKPPTHSLRLMIRIHTLPNRPIKTFRGNLRLTDAKGKVLFDEDIDKTEDVSFVDRTIYSVRIDPYNDDDENHRMLRFTDEKELKAVFVPTSVVFADGKEQSFE